MKVDLKIYIILLYVLIVFIIMTYSLYFFGERQLNSGSLINRIATKAFDYNTIKVTYPYDRDNKISIFYEDNCVYKDGITQNKMNNKYGWNCFNVYSDEKELVDICHFKKNNWHVNNYTFQINNFSDSLGVSLKINGPDSSEGFFYKKYKYVNNKLMEYYFDKDKSLYKIDTVNNKN